jgi:hypothetical protein
VSADPVRPGGGREGRGDRSQQAFGQIVRDGSLRKQLRTDPDATLAQLGLDERERTGMLGAGAKRLLVYHEMVHARLLKNIRSFLEGAGERIGDARLSADVRDWITTAGPTSRYLRDVAAEFLVWVRPRWETDESLPPWFLEYCDHVVAVRTIRNDPRPAGPPTDGKLELERPVACNATTRLYRYGWAVHRLPTPFSAEREPEPMHGSVVVGFRHPTDELPHFFDIKPRSAHMLERLLAGATLREALFDACAAMGETLDDEILSVTAVTLADLVDRGVILGS